MTTVIESALGAADAALFLQSPADVSRAAKAWRKAPVIGIDTEFVRERTYRADLGLVQLSDGHTVWLVDPLVDENLTQVKALLEDHSVIKLLHSPSEDLEVFRNDMDVIPRPMVDTQAACALLGQPLQLAYHAAAKWLLDVEVAKDQTRSNWLRRPLSRGQLRYAALDVCLLPEMWRRLKHNLEQRGRLDWLHEDCERQLRVAADGVPDDQAWARIRGVTRLDGSGLAVIRRLAAWRENEARMRNLPRGFVLPDAVLLQVALGRITSEARLKEVDGLHRRMLERYGSSVVAMVSEVIASGETIPEIRPLDSSAKQALNKLRESIKKQASILDIDPALLASRRELESALRDSPETWPDKFDGWRGRYVTEPLKEWAA
ncbi:MAG: ribonuclease D [Xanthomonadales bacterium]|nr:ribonuclease D [Xanthomonadales bacterium]NNE04569.1 ribonuclease D [Xanthomonadales bacterium]